MGIWERDEGLWETVTAALDRLGRAAPDIIRGSHPAHLAAHPLDLLVISPGAVGWAGAGAIRCHTVLLNGATGSLARSLPAESAVSYGTSPKDTLTLSSLEGDQICVALQRELVNVEGAVVERQELVLPFPVGTSPLPWLAAAGALLLLGVPPEQLME